LNTVHAFEAGRWENARLRREMRPNTAKFYYARLHTFFTFLVEEGAVDASPMPRLKPPIVRQDQVQPFTREQQQSLLGEAKRSRHPKRDEALILFLLDIGARGSEVCDLIVQDLELTARRCRVHGKAGPWDTSRPTRRRCFTSRWRTGSAG